MLTTRDRRAWLPLARVHRHLPNSQPSHLVHQPAEEKRETALRGVCAEFLSIIIQLGRYHLSKKSFIFCIILHIDRDRTLSSGKVPCLSLVTVTVSLSCDTCTGMWAEAITPEEVLMAGEVDRWCLKLNEDLSSPLLQSRGEVRH